MEGFGCVEEASEEKLLLPEARAPAEKGEQGGGGVDESLEPLEVPLELPPEDDHDPLDVDEGEVDGGVDQEVEAMEEPHPPRRRLKSRPV